MGWKELSLKLERDPSYWTTVRLHYLYAMKRQGETSGRFNLQEDKMIIEKLFSGKECSLENVRTFKLSKNEEISDMKRSGISTLRRWEGKIKPILISYHLGMLHSDWKEKFLNYVVEKRANYVKEIDWNEANKLFPAQNTRSMTQVLVNYGRSKELTLFKAIKENIHKYRGNDYSEREKLYRENIVKIYMEACKR